MADRISTKCFFDNVRLPRENLIGALNDGWRVSMTTLANEGGTNALSQFLRYEQIFNDLLQLARASRRNGRSAIQDPAVRQELARHYADLQGFRYNCLRVFSAIINGGAPGAEGSILELLASQLTAESAGAIEAGRWQTHSCAPAPTPLKRALPRSSATSSPSASWACPGRTSVSLWTFRTGRRYNFASIGDKTGEFRRWSEGRS